ncbi:helix-turn-helix domain-containing protein [uncultured Umboniibacter sp.]|uniref:helix-turn-helix domain-containing protein n=1 Tax=uncultured Umboniibacter sp. TaxID=1798917 RepID=UPI0026110BB6|nr:helix-turn-helix domain-containing protein [uncultured Umboniibacter sp.]
MDQVLFNLHDVALFITMYTCISFSVFLLFVRMSSNGRARYKFLAAFLIASACVPLDNLIIFGEAFREAAINFSPHIFHVFGTAYWVEAVFLLLFVRALIYREFKFRRYDGLLFLPLVFFVAYQSNIWFALGYDEKMAILQGYDLADEPTYVYLINLFREVFRAGCIVWALWEIRNYHREIQQQYADVARLDLTWLTYLLVGFLLIRVESVFVTLAFTTNFVFGASLDFESMGLFSNWVNMLLVSALGIFTLWRSDALMGVSDLGARENIETDNAASDESVRQEMKVEADRLEMFMSEAKPHLNHLLNIETLAKQLEVSPRALSQLINRYYECNFFEFVNRYRIEECRSLLEDESQLHLTMLDVMGSAGFNSKATFNTFFKKVIGKTPSQYRKDFHGEATEALAH